ncbi:hypothetical protein SADUNF_Sadunf03G0140600 [Salix dunnii]|uniref:Uncharacterized protein n=1 Tax=Salix dunnii TaxID=1413687 RepID=A0A835N4T6_9ROSI|nr:hypothetical protein SADUNF_Sadunf03G0140600 [Salix dunnii]
MNCPSSLSEMKISSQLFSNWENLNNVMTCYPLKFSLVSWFASSTAAQLLVNECSDQNDHNIDYYNVRNVPKLNIDTTKPFHTEDFFTGMLKAAALI